MQSAFYSFLAVILSLHTSLAAACSVCGFGEGETQEAFIITTGILTGIPLLALGGVLFFMSRRGPDDDQND